jgi:hypothetical protein
LLDEFALVRSRFQLISQRSLFTSCLHGARRRYPDRPAALDLFKDKLGATEILIDEETARSPAATAAALA